MNLEMALDRLERLWSQLVKLDVALVEAQRAAADICGTEDECNAAFEYAAIVETQLHHVTREFAMVAKFALDSLPREKAA